MANDFSGDPNCIADYRFEDGALTADSQGSNTLTPVNAPVADTVNYKEGSASVDLESTSNQRFTIADADTDAGWPMKNGTTNRSFSFTMWFRAESFPGGTYQTLFYKGATRICYYNGVHAMYLSWGGSLGTNTTIHACGGSSLVLGRWYFLAITYDDVTRDYRTHIWDSVAVATLGVDTTGAINAGYGDLKCDASINNIASAATSSWQEWDGNVDEYTVWNRALTTDEIDLIRQGLFPSTPSSSSSQSSSSSNSSFSSSSDSSSSSFVPRAWPTLTKGVEFDTQEIPGSHDITMPLGNGRTKARPRYTRRPHRWRIKLRLLTLADYLALEQFYLVDCRRSKYTFEFVEQGMAQTWLVRFDPDEPPSFSTMAEQPAKHTFEAVLLEDTVGTYGAGGYGAEYYDS